MAASFDFSSFRKKTLLLSRSISTRPTASTAIEQIYAPLLERAKAVSFDLFDTLTARTVYHPIDVFQFLAAHPAFRALQLPSGTDIAELRRDSEHAAYRLLKKKVDNSNANLREIYEVFLTRLQLDLKLAESLVLAEEEIELELAQPNEDGQVLFHDAARTGKPVIIISDTYHRPEFLARLLFECGYNLKPEQIYSSCHRRMNKGEGKLFVLAIRELGIQPAELLHLGDSGAADYHAPSKLGIATLWHPFRAHQDTIPEYHGEFEALHSQVKSLTERVRMPRRQPHDFWHQQGYSVMGPLMSGFALWLQRRFAEDKVDRAYFLLRDGELIHRVYAIIAGDDSPCFTRTLPASRRAMVFPSLEADVPLVIENLLATRPGPPRPVGSYLRRFELDPTQFEEEFAAVGLGHSGKLLDGNTPLHKVMELFARPRLVQAIVERAREERNLLLTYLKQEGVLEPGHISFVDVGWFASVQKALHALFKSQELPVRVAGHYLGTRAGMSESLRPDQVVSSYLFHSGKPRKLAKLVFDNCDVLETMCSSTLASLKSFRLEGGRIVPVPEDTPPCPEEHARNIRALHDGAAEFATVFRQRLQRYGWNAMPPEIAVENFLRLSTHPTTDEAVKLGAVVHHENLGTTTGRPLAAFRPESTEPTDLWQDYLNAGWKSGLLNQPTAQAAQLRTLIWLMQDVHPELQELLA